MFLRHLKLTKVRHRAVVGLVSLICVLSSATPTVAQNTVFKDHPKIKIGVRVIVPPIGEYQALSNTYTGFCAAFGKELEQELIKKNFKISVEFYPIRNEFIGD